jgi:hypothetical protein
MNNPERMLEHAERVRDAHLAERKLQKLDRKVANGHSHLHGMRERLAQSLNTGTEEVHRAA